jgi:hypothetical protein
VEGLARMALKIPTILKLLFANNDCMLKKAIGTLHLLQHNTRERRASVRYVKERAASTSNVFPPLPPAASSLIHQNAHAHCRLQQII